MSIVADFSQNSGEVSRYSGAPATMTVGGAFDCDLIVPGAPPLWFRLALAGEGPGYQVELLCDCVVDGAAAGAGRRFLVANGISVGAGGALAELRPSVAGVSEAAPVARPALRAPLKAAGVAACLALALALPNMATAPAISHAAAEARVSPPAAPRVEPDASQIFLGRLQRSGLVDGLNIGADGGALRISGHLDAPRARALHEMMAQAGAAGALKIIDEVSVEAPAPSVRLRAVSWDPSFVVREDGLRVKLGERLTDDWVLLKLEAKEAILQRDGRRVAMPLGSVAR